MTQKVALDEHQHGLHMYWCETAMLQTGLLANALQFARYLPHVLACGRMKEQQLQEAQASMGMSHKGKQVAERATEAACQAKRRMENEIARLQRLAAELESSKRCYVFT